jgi:hypothetical protein
MFPGAQSRLGSSVAALLVAAALLTTVSSGASASAASTRAAARVSMPSCSSTASIGYGEAPVDATIPVAGAIDCFTFAGVTGDTEFTNIAVTSGSVSPFLDIFEPDGTSACGGPYEGPGGCSLNATGTWTIELSDSEGTHTGSMNLAIQRLDLAVGCSTLKFGSTTVKGKIKAPASITCYKFTGSAGGVIYTHVVGVKGSLATPEMTLGAPNGSEPCGSVELGTLECTLSQTGTQSLLLYADIAGETDSFDISNQLLTKPVQCPTLIKHGSSKTSSISTIGQVRCFKFAGKNGEKTTTTLTGVTGTLDPLMDLFNPAGTSVAAGPGDSITYTLTSSGTWVVLIEDDSGHGTGDFTIALT